MLKYITGFFDADGSITLTRFKPTETRQLNVNFTNTDKGILEKIRDYFLTLKVKGWIITNKKRKENHLVGYQLVYYRQSGDKVMKAMLKFSLHQKKRNRYLKYLVEYRPLIKRNGKYSIEEKEKLEKVAQEVLNIMY